MTLALILLIRGLVARLRAAVARRRVDPSPPRLGPGVRDANNPACDTREPVGAGETASLLRRPVARLEALQGVLEGLSVVDLGEAARARAELLALDTGQCGAASDAIGGASDRAAGATTSVQKRARLVLNHLKAWILGRLIVASKSREHEGERKTVERFHGSEGTC